MEITLKKCSLFMNQICKRLNFYYSSRLINRSVCLFFSLAKGYQNQIVINFERNSARRKIKRPCL